MTIWTKTNVLRSCGLIAALVAAIVAIYFSTSIYTIPSASELLASPVSVVYNNQVMSVASDPYWSPKSTQLAAGTDSPKCSHGIFIVHMDIATVPPVSPPGLVVKSVWMHQNGQWWSGTISEPDTRDKDGHKSMLAYGCANMSFKPLGSVDVIIKFKTDGRIGYLRAQPKELGMR